MFLDLRLSSSEPNFVKYPKRKPNIREIKDSLMKVSDSINMSGTG